MAALNHDDGGAGVPHFLQVKNRKPLSKKLQEALGRHIAALGDKGDARKDYRKPKGMSWEDWDALEARRETEKREKSLARVVEVAAKYGDRSKAAMRAARPKKPRREELFAPSMVIRVLVKGNPCKAGTAAHAVFKKYKPGMTVEQFTKAAAGACPGKLRPVDYLVYDSRKGRVAVDPPKKGGAK